MQLVSGAEYQKSTATGTGRTVRPHVRRAHWHHYWVGEGRTRLEVRWIEPTFVLPEGKREVPVATVRRVLGCLKEFHMKANYKIVCKQAKDARKRNQKTSNLPAQCQYC